MLIHHCKHVAGLYTSRHCGRVGGQEQKHFSFLGTKLYFHVNYLRKKQSKNAKFTSNYKASPVDFKAQISLRR